ncbi:MAG: transcription antitermination protein NusB [Sphingobacteriales bacterium]|jgi:transcription antitermination protein NusB|nr:MAG: transcription antitermination protein NusB [Sphingobacteriales bacterium]
MLNRRQLRVKVFQSLYAYQLAENKDVSKHQKTLNTAVEQVFAMYIGLLDLIVAVINYADTDATEGLNKYIPSDADLNPNLKILNNLFVDALLKNEAYLQAVKKHKPQLSADVELVKSLFASLKIADDYNKYVSISTHTLTTDKDIVKFIFKKIILKSPLAIQAFEDDFISWTIDLEVLKAMFAKTLKNFSEGGSYALAQISADWAEDKAFITDLLYKTVSNDSVFQAFIANKTKNWDAERIALSDIIIMKMALSEFMFFASIPIKVSMNEYLDIAKEYSTPKSNAFINGILDKILADLTVENKIRKFGRGLN